jgi:hypothetical protein
VRGRQSSAYWGIVVASAFSESTGAHASRYCVAVRRSWVNVCGISLAGTVAEPRGLTPPAPGWRCECLPAKSDFCDGTHVPKSGGREPAVVCGIRPLSSEYPILFNEHRTGNRERRASARRGRGKVGATTIRPHTRTSSPHAQTGAAGVSPPWVCKPRLQMNATNFRAASSDVE